MQPAAHLPQRFSSPFGRLTLQATLNTTQLSEIAVWLFIAASAQTMALGCLAVSCVFGRPLKQIFPQRLIVRQACGTSERFLCFTSQIEQFNQMPAGAQ